jgi:hypothetical protein
MPEGGGGKKPRANGFVDRAVSEEINDPLPEELWAHVLGHVPDIVGQTALSGLSRNAHEASQHIRTLRLYHDLAGTKDIGSRFLHWLASRQFEAPKHVGADVVKHVDFMEKIFKRVGAETTPQVLWTAFLANPRVRFFPVPALRNEDNFIAQIYEVWAEPLGWVQREFVLTSFEECLADLDRANAGSFMGATPFDFPAHWDTDAINNSRSVYQLLAVAMKHMKTPMPVHGRMRYYERDCLRDNSLTNSTIRAVQRGFSIEIRLGTHYAKFSIIVPHHLQPVFADSYLYDDFFTALADMQTPPPLVNTTLGFDLLISNLVNYIGAAISGKADLVPDYWNKRTEFPETKDLTMAGAPNSMYFAIVRIQGKQTCHLKPLIKIPWWDEWEPTSIETAPPGTAVLQTILNPGADTVREQEWDWDTTQTTYNVNSVAYLAQWMAWLGGDLF